MGVDKHHRHMGIRCPGERIAGVPLVAGGVGEYIAAGVGGEEPVRDVDGDALFAFGPQSVREGGQVELSVVTGHRLDVIGGQ